MRSRLVFALAVSAAAMAASAQADYVPPGEDRFVVYSAIMAPAPIEVTNDGADYASISANVDSATYGTSGTTLVSSANSLLITSVMGVNNVGGTTSLAQSVGYGFYSVAAATQLQVDWVWASLANSGDWTVYNSHTDAIVASLRFSEGRFTVVGTGISQTASGTYLFNLDAGDYKFEADYASNLMPSSSAVTFTFVPAPGAVALLGVVGAYGARRRRG